MPDREELVVLVDAEDHELGTMEKMRAHREGELHRAVSVLVTDAEGRLILQRRADSKYHGGGLWSNTCCGHPRPDESPAAAAARRLREEMGLTCDLQPVAVFTYRAMVGPLIEHEVDHVFVGQTNAVPRPNPDEVSDWRAEPKEALAAELAAHPERFTPWFPLVLQSVEPAAS